VNGNRDSFSKLNNPQFRIVSSPPGRHEINFSDIHGKRFSMPVIDKGEK
jgi:hypothetical protein